MNVYFIYFLYVCIQIAQQKISEQDAKIVDLNWQVRHELTRNEGIEKVTNTISVKSHWQIHKYKL